MALPSDKPPSYEEATSQSLAPVENETDEAMEVTSTFSLPCPLRVVPAPDPAVPSTSSLPTTLPVVGDINKSPNTKMSDSLALAKAEESLIPSCPPPAGWVLSQDRAASNKAFEAGAMDYSKAKEAAGESSSTNKKLKPSTSETTNAAGSSSGPVPWANGLFPNGSMMNVASGTWGTSLMSAACPTGFEPALGVNAFILREVMANTERGPQRSAMVLQSASGTPMFMLKRNRAHHTRARFRVLELLDAAGSQVVATLESTKRAEVLSVEILCSPGNRIGRVETRSDSLVDSLDATILNAAEQAIFRLTIPPLGAIQTLPLQQVVSVASGSEVGKIQWAWGLEADLYEAQINIPGDLDVRMKIALIALCALSMEAFSRRWSVGKDAHKAHKHKRRSHKHHR